MHIPPLMLQYLTIVKWLDANSNYQFLKYKEGSEYFGLLVIKRAWIRFHFYFVHMVTLDCTGL